MRALLGTWPRGLGLTICFFSLSPPHFFLFIFIYLLTAVKIIQYRLYFDYFIHNLQSQRDSWAYGQNPMDSQTSWGFRFCSTMPSMMAGSWASMKALQVSSNPVISWPNRKHSCKEIKTIVDMGLMKWQLKKKDYYCRLNICLVKLCKTISRENISNSKGKDDVKQLDPNQTKNPDGKKGRWYNKFF